MKIMFLSYSPKGKSRDRYDDETQRQLQSYASPATEIVLAQPEDLGGIQFAEMLVRCRISHSPLAYPCLVQLSPEDITRKIF